MIATNTRVHVEVDLGNGTLKTVSGRLRFDYHGEGAVFLKGRSPNAIIPAERVVLVMEEWGTGQEED